MQSRDLVGRLVDQDLGEPLCIVPRRQASDQRRTGRFRPRDRVEQFCRARVTNRLEDLSPICSSRFMTRQGSCFFPQHRKQPLGIDGLARDRQLLLRPPAVFEDGLALRIGPTESRELKPTCPDQEVDLI